MPYQCVEVIVKLKAPPLGLFEGETPGRIVMRLQPHAHLDIQIDVKSPGLGDSVELATLTHRYPDWLGVDGYEKLLYDAIEGDQSHFVHSEEVIESWRIVDDLLCTGDSCPIRTTPYIHEVGSWAFVMKQIQLLIGTIQNERSTSSNRIFNRTYICHGTYMAR